MLKDLKVLLETYETLNRERKPGEAPFTLPEDLREVVDYVATSDCADGGPTPTPGCKCVCCKAARLRDGLWPEEQQTLNRDLVAHLLDVIEDARQLYRPSELVAEGFPPEMARNVTREYGDGLEAVVGLAAVEELAYESGVNPDSYPRYAGWQRTMRSLKAGIRKEWELPPVAGEED